MKKMIGFVLVSAMVGIMPLMASAQQEMPQGGGTETTTKTTKTTLPSGQTESHTSHQKKHLAPGEVGVNETKTTTKKVSHKVSGKKPVTTTEKTTKKPMHKATTHTVKTGKSAVKGTSTESNRPCTPTKTQHKTTKTSHMKKTGKSAVKQAPSSQTKTSTTKNYYKSQNKPAQTTTTGTSQVKEAPSTQPAKKESPVQKVEQGVKKTGQDIHQGWNKMIHHDQSKQ